MKTFRLEASSKEAMDRIEANTENFIKEFAKAVAPGLEGGRLTVTFDRYGDTEATMSINVVVNNG